MPKSSRGKNPQRTKQGRKKPQESSATAAEQVPNTLKKTAGDWTERPEAFKLLVECAALLRISEKIDPESEPSTPERLAQKAIGLIEACDLAFKTAAMDANQRTLEQVKILAETAAFRSPLDFYAGAKVLFPLRDSRPIRLESSIRKLLEKDFEQEPRQSMRYPESILRPLSFGDSHTWSPDLETFVNLELRWFKEKGFSRECLIRLHRLAKETGLASEED